MDQALTEILFCSTLDKLTAIMNEQPEMLAYFGLGVNMVKNQIEFNTKYERIKVI